MSQRVEYSPKKVASHTGTVLRWSPDGGAINFIKEENGVSNIWSQPVNGEPIKKLTNFSSGEIFYFDFAPDGSSLAVTRGSHSSDVILIDVSE